MMSGSPPQTVDAVLVDEEAHEVVLLLVLDSVPGVGMEQVATLQEKLNAYLAFALDGTLREHFPETETLKIVIRVECSDFPPSEPLSHFLDLAAAQLAGTSLDLVVAPLAG